MAKTVIPFKPTYRGSHALLRYLYCHCAEFSSHRLTVAMTSSQRIYEIRPRKSGDGGYAMTLIEIKPHRWGWKVFEAPGVEPVFPDKDDAIDYAQERACFRKGEIRILDSSGNLEQTIPFSEVDRKL